MRSVPVDPAIQAVPRRRLCRLLILAVCLVVPAAPARAIAPEYEPEERASALARPALVQVDIRWSAVVRGPSTPDATGAEVAPVEMFLRCSAFFVTTGGRLVTAAGCLDPAGARPFLLDRAVAATPVATRADRAALRAGLEASAVVEGDRTGAPGGDYALSIQWDRAGSRSGPGPGPDPSRLLDAVVVPPLTGGVAVLQAAVGTGGAGGDRPVVQMGTNHDLDRGDPVVALGYPGGVAGTESAGGFPVDRWGAVLSTIGPRGDEPFEVSAAAGGAMRGGPVLDMEGRAIGLSGFNGDSSEDTFSVVPAQAIADALRATGTSAAPGPLDADYRAGLDHFYKGEVDAAIARFEKVVHAPGRHDAAAFLARARDIRTLDDQRGKGLPVLAVVIAVVVVGAAILALRTRSRANSPQPVNRSSRGNPEGGRVP